ncbi:MAG TPA: YafY family protein [Dehalococcoidia bacterium]|nr:YafY family protein [Dehalococcoidia bacterium]
MRADRLLSILLLLQAQRRLTARALAARLEVSERTIQRDMEALCAAGVPVYAERGRHGGWTLAERYRVDVPGLSEAEVQALFLGTPPALLADLGLAGAAQSALIKLLVALPALRRHDAEYARQRIFVDTGGWRRGEEPVPLLPALQEAVWQDRRLDLLYERSDGASVRRTVDPLGLVAKGRVWYLVAAVEGEPRTYRVSRVRDATPLAEAATRPADFDLAAYWTASSARFTAGLPRYPVRLRAAPEMLSRLGSVGAYMRVEAQGQPDAEGWCELALSFQFEDEACGYILSFGGLADVIEPAALRERLLALAHETLARYGEDSGPASPFLVAVSERNAV